MKHISISLFLLFTCLCADAQKPWYHTTAIYQIYPRSYYDSNQDGIGDINGIIQKLDYIQSLGFETIWCSPFFSSPQQDFGYDIADYQNIAPEYGTLADAERLIAEVHQRGMKIVFDMVMNHTSIQHPWFERDLLNHPDSSHHDFYVWRNKPNNWKSMVTGTAWHYHPARKQYYYAAFLPFQPDLNYRNPEVQKAMLDNVRFWLDKGVDGFRLDIFNSIYEDSLFRNNIGPFNRKYTANLPECLAFAEKLRAVCDEYGEKMLIGEITGPRHISRQYCGEQTNNRLTQAFVFEMLRFRFKARYFHALTANMERDFAHPFMPVYVYSNHDRRRAMERLKGNTPKAKLLHLYQLTVRGVPCLYYGEEIGMRDNKLPYKNALDPIPHHVKLPRGMVEMADETLNRDDVRTPMQWSNTKHAGFTTGDTPWLPVHTNYTTCNVQQSLIDSASLWHSIRKVMHIRNNMPAFTQGDMELLKPKGLPAGVLALKRVWNEQQTLVLLNFSKRTVKFNAPACGNNLLYSTGEGNTLQGGIVHLNSYGVLIISQSPKNP